jgi:endonuclease YncB( thermonuclease family)
MNRNKLWVIIAGVIASLILVAEMTGVVPEEIITGAETILDLTTEVSTEEEIALETETEAEVESPTVPSATSTTLIDDALYYVVRVIDGDTIEVERNGELATVRYIGIDTPEVERPNQAGECYGTEAKYENARLVHGMPVRLVRDVSDTDQYGRLLRYVYYEDKFINLALVQGGFAEAKTYNPNIAKQSELDTAETAAVAAKRGIWSETCSE